MAVVSICSEGGHKYRYIWADMHVQYSVCQLFGFFPQRYSFICMTALAQSHHILSVILPPLPQSSLEVISPKENPNPPTSFLPRMSLSTPVST